MVECKDCIHFEVCAYVKHDLPACDSFASNVEPVVRCRECKYHKPIDYCEKHKQTGWFSDDFCSRGQRKEN